MSLSLYPYARKAPLRYIDDETVKRVLALLEEDAIQSLRAVQEYDARLSHALRSLVRPGSSWGREHPLRTDDARKLLEFEHVWHPEYQRYAEHIVNHLVLWPLAVMSARRQKKYTQLKLGPRVDFLCQCGLGGLVAGLNPVIRNAIAHGTSSYTYDTIVYTDGAKRRELTADEFGAQFDALVCSANSTAVGFLSFIIRNADVARAYGFRHLPFGLRLMFLTGATAHDDLVVDDGVEVDIPEKPQLNLFCQSSTAARTMHLAESLSLAVAAQEFSDDKYGRIASFVDVGRGVPSLAVLNGAKVRDARHGHEISVDQLFESSLLWHNAPWIARRLWKWRTILRHSWREYRDEVVHRWRQSGLPVWSTRYHMRDVRVHGSALRRNLAVEIVLNHDEMPDEPTVVAVMLHAVSQLRRRPILGEPFGHWWRIPTVPDRIFLRLHSNDAPARALRRSGWDNPHLLAKAEWISWPRRNKEPLWAVGGVEVKAGHHIRLTNQLDPSRDADPGTASTARKMPPVR